MKNKKKVEIKQKNIKIEIQQLLNKMNHLPIKVIGKQKEKQKYRNHQPK